jgi:hypothetical protein
MKGTKERKKGVKIRKKKFPPEVQKAFPNSNLLSDNLRRLSIGLNYDVMN